MKKYIWILILLSACSSSPKQQTILKTIPNSHNGITDKAHSNGMYHMLNVYAVGDVNGDHKTDTAFVDYDIPMGADSSPDYYSGALSKTIKFRNNLPQIEIEQSLGLLVKGTQVTNLNKGTDILVFNRCFLGIWKDMSVYTLFQKKWLEIGHTRIAGEDDQDFDNRIINLKNQYYLLGDKWDDTIGVIKRADTVNIMLL